MTRGGIGKTPAAATRCREVAADPDSITPWDELVGGGEASFADVLRGLRPLIPSSLLDGEGWLRLLERLAELPAAAAAFFGFEFRLGDPDPSADVCVPLTSDVAASRPDAHLSTARYCIFTIHHNSNRDHHGYITFLC